MAFYRLSPASFEFPSPHLAGPDGLLAVGGDFRPERMIAAYSSGIFPWMVYSGEPVWFSPDPRMVLEPRRLHVHRSLAKIVRRGDFEIRLDTALPEVIKQCSLVKRPGQRGSWISRRYTEGILDLWGLGLVHTAEAWVAGKLVGGLYGLGLGRVFFGESMYALEPDASKVAFATLVRQLAAWGFELVDCQQETDHLRRFGAEAWPRARFLAALAAAMAPPPGTTPDQVDLIDPLVASRAGRWTSDLPPWDGRTDGAPFVAGGGALARAETEAVDRGEDAE